MNMGPGNEDASHSLFAETTGRINVLWKKTGEDNYGKQELRSTTKHIWFLNKTDIYCPISTFITQINFCLYNLNLNFELYQNRESLAKIGRQGDCTKNRDTHGKIGRGEMFAL